MFWFNQKEFCCTFWIFVKFIISKFVGVNPKSSKVKTYEYSPLYFGIMIRVKIYMIILIIGFMMNFKF